MRNKTAKAFRRMARDYCKAIGLEFTNNRWRRLKRKYTRGTKQTSPIDAKAVIADYNDRKARSAKRKAVRVQEGIQRAKRREQRKAAKVAA